MVLSHFAKSEDLAKIQFSGRRGFERSSGELAGGEWLRFAGKNWLQIAGKIPLAKWLQNAGIV